MATAAELARRNAAAMEGFRSSLRSSREGAETRAAFHAAELADRRREKQAEADRRAQTINTIVGMLGGLAQTGVSSAVQAGQQREADDRRAQAAIDLQNLRNAHAIDLQNLQGEQAERRARLAHQRQVAQNYLDDLDRRYPAGGTMPAATAAAEPLPEPRSSIFDPEYKESVMRSDVQAGWEGVEPLLREVGLTNEFTENYAGFMGEGDTPEDGQRKWRDAAMDRTKHAFWSAFGEIVVDNPDVLNDSGEATREDIEAWNKALGAGNWDEAERLLGNNSSLVAFRNFVYGPPATVDEPTLDADPGPQTMGESLLRDADTPSGAAGGTPVVTGEGTLTDVVINALVNNPLLRTLSGLPLEEKDNIPATERSDRAKDALVRAENEGNLTGEESGLVPQLIQFADQLQLLESLNELQAAKGEEPLHDLTQDWFELEKWVQEIEQPGGRFEDVPNWPMHQRGAERIRSGEVKAGAIAKQLSMRISNLGVLVPGSQQQRAQQALNSALFSGTGRGG